MAKYKKMTEEEFSAFVAGLKPYSVFFDEDTDFFGQLIAFGTGDSNQNETVKANPAHAGTYIGDGTGKTFEADGDKLAFHLIVDYKKKLMEGTGRLITFNPRSLTVDEIQLVKKAISEYAGKNYNKLELLFYSIWGIINKFTVFGALLAKVNNPAYRKDSVVCSQLTLLCFKYIPRIYDVITKDKAIDNMTPEELFDRILRAFDFGMDSNTFTLPAK